MYMYFKVLDPLSRFPAAFSERGAKTLVIFSAGCFRTKLLPRRSENAAVKRPSPTWAVYAAFIAEAQCSQATRRKITRFLRKPLKWVKVFKA
jgi:hypothetical protein